MNTKSLLAIFAIVLCMPVVLAENCSQFKTYDQAAWGTSASKNNSGTYRNTNFPTAFPTGAMIGMADGHNVLFTNAKAVQLYLPATGAASVLNESGVNVTKTSAGILGGEVLSLTLNVGFDDADESFGSSTTKLKDLVVADGICAGMTVQQVLDAGNALLSGLSVSLTPLQLQNCTHMINKNYYNGSVDNGHLVCQSTMNITENETESNVTEINVSVNTTQENVSVNVTNTSSILTQEASLRIAPWYPKGSHYVFFCNASVMPTNYSWYFGDGEKLLQIKNSNVYHIYKQPGSYVVRCVVHGVNASSNATMNIVV
jgi:hypothetical protein